MFPRPMVDIFGDLVKGVESVILADLQTSDPGIQTINYQYGHPVEIIETLAQYDKSPTKRYEKYPLVILVQDFPESHGGEFYAEHRLRIVIAHHTKADYKAKQRYEHNFKPVLYPIYTELLNQITQSYELNMQPYVNFIEHTKYDRLYWGRESLGGNNQNTLCDYVDAIELTNLRLTQKNYICSFPINS